VPPLDAHLLARAGTCDWVGIRNALQQIADERGGASPYSRTMWIFVITALIAALVVLLVVRRRPSR